MKRVYIAVFCIASMTVLSCNSKKIEREGEPPKERQAYITSPEESIIPWIDPYADYEIMTRGHLA